MMTLNFDPIPINPNVPVRNTNWIQVCPHCQNERILGYAQIWNIRRGACIKECKPCGIKLGLIVVNTEAILKIPAFKGGTTGKKLKGKSIQNMYQHLFNSLNKNIKTREKFKQAKLGKYGNLSNNWKGGITTKFRLISMSREPYKVWRKEVFSRDNYTCQICFVRGGKLEADHIKEWCNYPEFRYDVSNGRTLCKACHKTTDNYGNKAKKKELC